MLATEARDRFRELAPRRVHHFFTDFDLLERRYPGKFPREIVSGDGAYLVDADGNRLLDGCQHLGACPVGHARGDMADAIANQIRTLEFVSLDEGHSHPWVVELCERLAPLVPPEDPKFYFGSSGSEAVETALKMARVFHERQGEPQRKKIVARDGSYHGVGYGALSANGNPVLREPFAPLVPGFVRAPELPTMEAAAEIEAIVEREDPSTIAALIAEPIAMHGSVKVPEEGYWAALRELCDRHGILLIADEVVDGFGRTGRMFGCDHYGVKPDVAVVAKGITSSYVPMGAAIASRHVADAFAGRPFMHNATYSGHPVACAAARTALEILQRERLPEHAAELEPRFRAHLDRIGALDGVTSTSVAGMLSSVSWVAPGGDAGRTVSDIAVAAYDRGVLVRGFAKGDRGATFFYPPLVATADDVDVGFGAIGEVLDELL